MFTLCGAERAARWASECEGERERTATFVDLACRPHQLIRSRSQWHAGRVHLPCKRQVILLAAVHCMPRGTVIRCPLQSHERFRSSFIPANAFSDSFCLTIVWPNSFAPAKFVRSCCCLHFVELRSPDLGDNRAFECCPDFAEC